MGNLACGCLVEPGRPVELEVLRRHYAHTLEALMFWELLRAFPGKRPEFDTLDTSLPEARIAYIEALDRHFPQAIT